MTAVYHPAALLRDPQKKVDMYLDMKKIKAALDELEQKKRTSETGFGGAFFAYSKRIYPFFRLILSPTKTVVSIKLA